MLQNPTIRSILGLLLDLYAAGRRWMIQRGVPLWAAPLALLLIFGACSYSRAHDVERQTMALCKKELRRQHGPFATWKISSIRTSQERHLGQIQATRGDRLILCTVATDERRVYDFSEH